METKIIKFHDNNTTYVPVTLASAVQYSYTGGVMSVQKAIGTVASTLLPVTDHFGKTVSLSSAANSTSVTLGGTAHEASGSVEFTGGSYITVSGATAGKINVSAYGVATSDHTHTSELSVNPSAATITYNTGGAGSKTTAAYKASTNSYGFAKYDSTPTSGSGNAVTSGGLYTALSGKASSTHSHVITWNGSANYTPTADTVNVLTYFNSSTTTLNNDGTVGYTTATVPTKKYVDDKITSIGSALSFSGTVDGSHALPTSNVKVGMTYLVGAAGTFAGQTCEKGDMIIAYSNSPVEWAVVQANWTAVDGDTALNWGSKTTLATIGGVTIDATMPAKPTLSATKSSTGNFVKQITVDDHAITYVLGYAYNKVTQSGTTGVVTSVTGSNDTLTVTSKNIDFTDSEATKAATDTTLSTTTTYVVTKVEQAANGELSVTKTGIKIPAASNTFSNLSAGTDDTGNTAGTANTGSAAADTAGDTIIFKGGNKWITTGVTDTSNNDTVIINHAINSASFAKTTADVYSIKIDNAGHITEATAAAIGTVGINSLSYSVSNASVDEFILFDGTWGTANNVAALTGDTKFVK